MSDSCTVTIAVIVPARNEAERISACLGALAAQAATGLCVVLVANDCVDDTVAIARSFAQATGLTIDIVDCALPAGTGVGTARRWGCAQALTMHPHLTTIMTTDADCTVADDWIDRNLCHLRRAAAVCGRVEPMATELSVLPNMNVHSAEMEGRYEQLVMAVYRRFQLNTWGLAGDHGAAAGASLAITTAAYLAVGGFADISSAEDRDLVRRLKGAGHRVWHASDVRVAASCRLDGRAAGGMAQALRARAERTDYLIDDGLPPAHMLIAAAMAGRLDPWPLQVSPEHRLYAKDLGPHIALLEELLGRTSR